ncbi:MAG: cytochrome c oxidase subunit II [Halobacteriales archaeon]
MEIHRFEAVWTAVSLLLIVGWIATVTYGAVGPPGVQMVDAEGGTVADPANPADSPNFREPGVYRTGADQYAVYVVAQQFLFDPGSSQPIRVPAGSTVTFYLTSADVIHGFEVVGTNVNAMVIPGQVTKITVAFEEPATYGIVCNEYCGSGHHAMEGRLEVVPAAAFEGGA